MGRYLWWIAIAFVLYAGWQRFSDRGPPPPSLVGQSADIEIYTTTRCPYCRDAKAYMDKRGIAYLEKNVEEDIELRKEFRARGGYGVPYFFVYGEPLQGFDPGEFEKLRAQGS